MSETSAGEPNKGRGKTGRPLVEAGPPEGWCMKLARVEGDSDIGTTGAESMMVYSVGIESHAKSCA